MTTALIGLGAPAASASAAAEPGPLNMYSAQVSPEAFDQLRSEGYDVVNPRPTAGGIAVDLVLSSRERTALAGKGIDTELLRTQGGATIRQAARAQARNGFSVWRDYDGPDGLRQYLTEFEAEHEDIAKLKVIGQTLHGRDIVAIRITEESRGKRGGAGEKVGDRPAVLYQGTTHAREWISTEVTRRLMEHFAGNSAEAKRLRERRQLWFLPVVNPDGYQYTFDHERLWRRNLRDNDGDGQLTNFDGVDLNRNYPEHWKWDDEGSNTAISSDTYRGTAPASEPETQASIDFVRKIDPVLADSYHSYGPLLLYPEGWQIQTPARDLPVYLALSGNDENPAVEGTDPDVSAELYTTNGEFTDWAHHEQDVLAWTSELNEGCQGCGFVFPDDEGLVQNEFEINLPFALDMARSAGDPARPQSHLGNTTEPFYLELVSEDPTFANNPLADFRFQQSYGDPQPVDVLARNSLRKVRLHYRINGGKTRKAKTERWEGGETYGEGYDTYYGVRRGEVTGTDPGDTVEVWFSGKEKKKGGKARAAKRSGKVDSESFTYEAVSESGAGTLVVAAEDYTGISPAQPGGPNYLQFYRDALNANGIAHDVFDVDAEGRTASDQLGVLSHYDAVLFYTGDDIITREPGMVPGTASRLANDEMLELRAYLNEGGNLLYTGKNAGVQYQNLYLFDPVDNAPCAADDDEVTARCQLLSDDFLQYDLGAYIYNDGGGLNQETGEPFPVDGVASPFEGLEWDLVGGTGAGNQDWASSLVTTSTILPEDEYPQFASDAPAQYDRGGGPAPFEPIDGSQYLYSQRGDESYKRLTRSFDLSGAAAADNPALAFKASYDTEPAWDHVIVEARTAGQDDWTTLPEPEHTTTDPGDSCPGGWEELHPFLRHYQTLNEDGTCSPTGTEGAPPGEWNAATGRSAGWEQWNIDLSGYADKQVEISITYISDWAVQGLGVFLDDIEVTPDTLGGTTSFEDDGDPFDGWEVTGPAEGSGANPNNWLRTGSVGIEEGAAVATDDSLFFGFGFEGIADALDRKQVMGNSVNYLLGSP
ncbi:MAG: M14 family zinc carboxypeptidase [Solirubrobacterales bacterium]